MIDLTPLVLLGVFGLFGLWIVVFVVRFIVRVFRLFHAEQAARRPATPPNVRRGTPRIDLAFDPNSGEGLQVSFGTEADDDAFDERGTMRTKVAGVTHPNADGTSRQAIIARCREGDRLLVDREPKNAFDPNAVRISRVRGEQLGYLPRGRAAELAPWMDRGHRYEAKVIRIFSFAFGEWSGVLIHVTCVKPGPRKKAKKPRRRVLASAT